MSSTIVNLKICAVNCVMLISESIDVDSFFVPSQFIAFKSPCGQATFSEISNDCGISVGGWYDMLMRMTGDFLPMESCVQFVCDTSLFIIDGIKYVPITKSYTSTVSFHLSLIDPITTAISALGVIHYNQVQTMRK